MDHFQYFFSGMLLLSYFILQSEACDKAIQYTVANMPQLTSNPKIYMADKSYWTVLSDLVPKVSTQEWFFGKLSSLKVVGATTIITDGQKYETTLTEYEEKSVSNRAGSIMYSYMCSKNLVGLVECKNSESSPTLYALANMDLRAADLNKEINGCRKRMLAVHKGSNISQLADPFTKGPPHRHIS